MSRLIYYNTYMHCLSCVLFLDIFMYSMKAVVHIYVSGSTASLASHLSYAGAVNTAANVKNFNFNL